LAAGVLCEWDARYRLTSSAATEGRPERGLHGVAEETVVAGGDAKEETTLKATAAAYARSNENTRRLEFPAWVLNKVSVVAPEYTPKKTEVPTPRARESGTNSAITSDIAFIVFTATPNSSHEVEIQKPTDGEGE